MKVEPPAALPVLDPYLQWAELTARRYLLASDDGGLRVAGVLKAGRDLDEIRRIAGVSLVPAPSVGAASHFSARITQPADAVYRALAAVADFVLAQPGMKPVGPTCFGAPLPAPAAAVGSRGRPARLQPRVVVGVIDGRCGFLHSQLCHAASPDDPPRTRIGHFWDQSLPPGAGWLEPGGFDYGRELTAEHLDRHLAAHLNAAQVRFHGARAQAERALYARLDQALPADADWSHGTHVLSTLLTDIDRQLREPPVDAEPIGVVVVQLPDAALRDTSARWTASYVLDAVRYVLDRAGPEARVVINLSLGAFGGPLDGSSLLERAIDQWIDECSGDVAVVVAAGNTAKVRDDGTGVPVRCHASARVPARGSVSFDWDVSAEDTTDSFLEIHVPASHVDGIGVRLQHADRRLGATHLVRAEPGDSSPLQIDKTVIAAVLNASGRFQGPNGHGGLVLVALGHTAPGAAGGPVAPSGRWTVSVENLGDKAVAIDVCVERRDVPGELAGERPQYGLRFNDALVQAADGVLASLARGRNTLVVSAFDEDPDADTYRLSDFAARGSAARRADFSCKGERRAAGVLSGTFKSLAGTSMAAAELTAAVAALWREKPGLRSDELKGALNIRAAEREQARRAGRKPVGTGPMVRPKPGVDPAPPAEPPQVAGGGTVLLPVDGGEPDQPGG